MSVQALAILACIGRIYTHKRKKADQSGFFPRVLESEDGEINWPVYMENGPHRGDGLIVLHDARKLNVPAHSTI